MSPRVITLPITQHGIAEYFYEKWGLHTQTATVHQRGGVVARVDSDHPTSPFSKHYRKVIERTGRLGAPSAASPTRTTPPQSGGKREAPSKKGSQRASGDAKHRRAHKCPKGHYWSYKHKKCMKSKF